MRNALNTDGTRMLSRMEWLTKLQILGFFSRLSAKRKQSDGKETSAVDDDEELFEEYASLTDEQMLEKASVAVESEIGVKHLVMYDVYNLCEIAYENRLLFSRLRCSGKRAVCKHFEIPSNLRDIKSSLVKVLSLMVQDAWKNQITQCKFQTTILVNWNSTTLSMVTFVTVWIHLDSGLCVADLKEGTVGWSDKNVKAWKDLNLLELSETPRPRKDTE